MLFGLGEVKKHWSDWAMRRLYFRGISNDDFVFIIKLEFLRYFHPNFLMFLMCKYIFFRVTYPMYQL